MIQITPHMRILVAIEPVDFLAGIDGLAAVCRKRLQADPMTGTLFVFGNRRRTAIRILVYDGQGFWLCSKRLSTGKFPFWPAAHTPAPAAGVRVADAAHGRRSTARQPRAQLAPAARGCLREHGLWFGHVRQLSLVVPRQPQRGVRLHALGVQVQRLQVLEGVDAAGHAGGNQADVDVATWAPLFVLKNNEFFRSTIARSRARSQAVLSSGAPSQYRNRVSACQCLIK